MAQNNAMVVNDNDSSKDVSPELFYEISQVKAICLSMAAEKQANTLSIRGNLTHDSSPQHVPEKHPTLTLHGDYLHKMMKVYLLTFHCHMTLMHL